MSEDEEAAGRLAELEADNRRLRRLLDQHGTPGELRHRLRNTLGMLRTIIRKSAQTPREVEDFAGHIEDRLEAIARAQSAVDQFGAADIHGLIAEELLHYGASEGGERVVLNGPQVELHARAAQVFALAVHELAVNALEHGALGDDHGHVQVDWEVVEHTDVRVLRLSWRESGVDGLTPPTHQGFGAEVLERMLPYELKARTAMTFEPGGLRCTIEFPLAREIGALVE